ncbi:MAG: dihydrolipoyl dehydrogenase family protein [Brevinema sp.]
MPIKQYDLIVIGGGSGGLTCSIGASKLGKKVLLVEQRKIGGECTWSGCIPSKAFIQYSKQPFIDKTNILQKVRAISEEIYTHETPEVLESYGVDVLLGSASFKTKNIITVNKAEYQGKKIVICTGTSPFVPNIEGLNKDNLLTNDNFFLQEQLPDSIIFIGAGVISLELSIPLARLGVKVSILEKNSDILQISEPTIAENVKKILKQYNIDLYVDIAIQKINTNNTTYSIHFTQNNSTYQLQADKFFVASGRTPNIAGLNLEHIGVQYDSSGITVNEYLETSQRHIVALGDVVGPFRFSHVAGLQGEVFVRNLITPFFKKKYFQETIPYVVFTDPEFAQVGMTEKQATNKYGKNIKVYKYCTKDSERAIISLEEYFYFQIITHKGLIVGATVMGSKAGEIANLLQWFYVSKTPFRNFVKSVQAYPSYGDFLRKVAKKIMIDDLLSLSIVAFFRSSK